ncbi:maltokinase [Streptomyces varsoviensis]|uniref:maltokinase N-terminal cap-like domain-containing protein n=1 Tax=Streptomyces varsoviensis TaxID=67373 RepID=UPI0033EAD5EB
MPEGFSARAKASSGGSTAATAATAAAAAAAGRPVQAAAGDAGLLASLVPLLAEWLPRQRWFAGKGRPITGFTPVAVTELLPSPPHGTSPGLLHLLVRAQQSGAQPEPADAADCYQLLLGVRQTLPPQLAPALIGRPAQGPLHGLTVYEALADARLSAVLLERLRTPGRLGPLRFTHTPGALIDPDLTPRLVTAEQSNTSVVYGETYILKLFRRVCPGANPDLELPLALARAKCSRVPAPVAWYEAVSPEPAAEPMTLGVLQNYLASSADGWQLALNSLSLSADFAASARALGHATAEVHLALADTLPTVTLRRPQLEHLAVAMTERLEATAAAVPALRPYGPALHAAYESMALLGRAGRTWTAQRIHGDLHLGQTLRTAVDSRWSLIDFEGEPARPLAERRRPQPVARDLAGMLRSFDYAAAVGHATSGAWSERARTAYCDGYAATTGADPREDPALLRAYVTDKAVYEVLYEARHRPDWLPVPMSAIRRLAAGAHGGELPDGGPA